MLAELVPAGGRIRSATDAQLSSGPPLRLHLERDAPICAPMTVPTETPQQIRHEIAPEETHPAVTVELEDVFVLVAA